MAGRQITVRGRVQGVGFRPFVWRLAQDAGVTGHVLNDNAGVRIAVWGADATLDAFQCRLTQSPPPLAQIASITAEVMDATAPAPGFHIAQSGRGAVQTEITPDAATCPDCLAEMRDPANRRFRYPFTNCTHCGPRLSIVTGLPYDRARTSMAAFTMCADCAREYSDPADRRFHAQPNACPVCGPQVWLEDATGRIACDDPVAEVARRLAAGKIIAIKGIGGVHLACDATNAAAVQRLRDRKQRVAKPFALMARDLGQIAAYCMVSNAETALLQSPAAPIVLLQARPDRPLAGIAPGLNRIGVMLPHSPLHHLLMDAVAGPLVMTSGNVSGAPQVTTNDGTRERLAGIADAFLLHDRDIVNRLDDSLMRLDQGGPAILRRGRGLAPAPLTLPEGFADLPPTLAMGAELKTTFCLLKDSQSVLSQHIGDLTDAETYADYRAKIALFTDLYDVSPEVIAVDLHPDYLSTRWGTQVATKTGAKLVRVQHHHAHLASCLAENGIAPDAGPSVGIILDGAGLGTDGTIWGGEVLLGDYCGFDRMACFAPVPLPGGDQAARQPWRNLLAQLIAAFGADWQARIAGTPIAAGLATKPVAVTSQMIAQGLNAPLASSAGRLFDAVAAALGIAFDQQDYEGQAAMQLEALIGDTEGEGGYPAALSDTGVLSWEPLWTALIADLRKGTAPGIIAARFHAGLACQLAEAAAKAAETGQTDRVVLSGGVMQNRVLAHQLEKHLQNNGLRVLCHRRLPANDGGLSLGQACIAALQGR